MRGSWKTFLWLMCACPSNMYTRKNGNKKEKRTKLFLITFNQSFSHLSIHPSIQIQPRIQLNSIVRAHFLKRWWNCIKNSFILRWVQFILQASPVLAPAAAHNILSDNTIPNGWRGEMHYFWLQLRIHYKHEYLLPDTDTDWLLLSRGYNFL